MRAIAAWLVDRPRNGVFGLATTLLLPMSPILSGMVMAHLVFANGIRVPVVQALVAGSVLAVIALVMNVSAIQIAVSALTWWVPVFLLAALAGYWRSMTLALQVSAIVALLGTLGFFVVVGDPIAYWNNVITASVQVLGQAGLQRQADMLLNNQAQIVPQMTMLFVSIIWTFYVVVTLLGYALFQLLPDMDGVNGRFCDLNFGRVIAVLMAVTSVAAVLTGSAWLQNVGFVSFIIFWLQGLAVIHWLQAAAKLPSFVLIMVYASLPILNALLVVPLAVLGYTDAWFDFRTRIGMKKKTRLEK